jgi:flagellar biosynthetic protein FliQ
LFVGVSIALFQALTQIQEITLVFVPKILAIFASIFVLFPSMVSILQAFMNTLADRIIGIQ